MARSGSRYLHAKSSVRGIALVKALVLSFMVAVFILALYGVFTRLFRATEEVRVYVSVREAAASGARYAASLTNFPVEWEENRCANFNLDFRIAGRDEIGIVDITICRISSTFLPGQEVSGTSREPVTGSTQTGAIFKITSTARFPANAPTQESRVEAIYVR